MFQKLIKYCGKKNVLCFYPGVIKTNFKYETKKFSIDEIINIKEKIKKAYKDVKIINAKQIEYYYKDLVKVNIEIIKNNDHVILDNNLLVITNIVFLDELQYPILSHYDYTYSKNMEIYKIGNIEILFVSCNEQTTIYLDISSMKDNDELLFNQFLNLLKF
jgi:hypothetical protein